nr:MAG TPA: hypothetical protein [Caudoviricetes sp.]
MRKGTREAVMFPRPPQRRPYKAPPFLIGHQGYPGAFCYV